MIKPIPIKLDETRYLYYRSEDMEAFEDMLGGQSWQKAVQEQGEKRLKLLLWAGLRTREKGLTVAQVGGYLDAARRGGVQLVDLWRSLLEALQASGFLPPGSDEMGFPATTDEPRPGPSLGTIPSSTTGSGGPSA